MEVTLVLLSVRCSHGNHCFERSQTLFPLVTFKCINGIIIFAALKMFCKSLSLSWLDLVIFSNVEVINSLALFSRHKRNQLFVALTSLTQQGKLYWVSSYSAILHGQKKAAALKTIITFVVCPDDVSLS